MIIIFRWWFLSGMSGLVLGVYSGMELDLARTASPEPVPIRLAALEAGEMPPQPHVRIGRHIAQYDRGITVSRGEHVASVYYPIAMPTGWAEATALSEPARHTTVVVKTREFTHFDEVPEQAQEVAELSGILTTADRLVAEDRSAVMRMVGGRSARAVPVLEAHRRPREELTCWIGLGIAGVLFLLAIHLFRRKSRRARKDDPIAGLL
jgi:hypothetical protein